MARSETLLPCPNPACKKNHGGQSHFTANAGEGRHWVVCQYCFMHGPVCAMPDECEAAWNALPRPTPAQSTADKLPDVERNIIYRRQGDMSPDGELQILVEDDGDVILTIRPDGWKGDISKRPASVQFCTVGSGGGKSPQTWNALRELARAMRADCDADQSAPASRDDREEGGKE
jgi:hypothetical protein